MIWLRFWADDPAPVLYPGDNYYFCTGYRTKGRKTECSVVVMMNTDDEELAKKVATKHYPEAQDFDICEHHTELKPSGRFPGMRVLPIPPPRGRRR